MPGPDAPNKVEWKDVVDSKLSKDEKVAIDQIKEASKNTPEQLEDLVKQYFNIPKGEKTLNAKGATATKENKETKDILEYAYRSMLNQICRLYLSNTNQSLGRSDNQTLDAAFVFMKLINPDKYGADSPFEQKFVTGKIRDGSGDKQTYLLYPMIETDMQELFRKPIALEATYGPKDTKEVTESDAALLMKQGWKKVGEREVKGESQWEVVDKEKTVPNTIQYFYKGRNDVDIAKGITSVVPALKQQILALQSDSNVEKNTIKLEVNSSVSNITYTDNEGLIGRRSAFIQEELGKDITNVPINISNPDYTDYGPERGPGYPPTMQDQAYFNECFPAGSDAMKALQAVGFTDFADVVKSMTDNKANSKCFDVLEQYMYRNYQYANVKIVYKEKKEIPKTEKIIKLEKLKAKDADENPIEWKNCDIIAKNPFYHAQEGLGHEYGSYFEGKLTPLLDLQVNQGLYRGVLIPLNAAYIKIHLSDNAMNNPVQLADISKEGKYASANYDQDAKSAINKQTYTARKHGSGAAYSETLCVDLKDNASKVIEFVQMIEDGHQGMATPNKQYHKFIDDYLKTLPS